MSREIQFCPMEPADAQEFFAMAEEFYHSSAVLHPIPPEYHRRAFAEILHSRQYLEGYFFRDGSAAAGFAVTNRMMQHEAGGLLVWVEDLYVRPAYQGQGIGSRFLRWLETRLQGEAAALRLETEPENTGARRLYQRLGYEPVAYLQLQKRLEKPLGGVVQNDA